MKKESHYKLVLSGVVVAVTIHLITSLLLIIATILVNRYLLLPWLITDMLTIIVITIIFIGWTFLSFFVDLLAAIVFPILGGTILGLWIYSWRNVNDFFIIHGLRSKFIKQELQESICSVV